VVEALLAMAASDAANGRAFNVASGVGTSLIDVANQIVAIAGAGHVEHVAWPTLAEQIETGDFVADVSRAKRELGWKPVRDLVFGLGETVAHYRAAIS
jgi:UDP-glucose 4-epimerase